MSDVDGWIAKYLGYVDRTASMIPYARAKIWKESFFNPAETLRKDNVSVGQRIKDLYALVAIDILLVILALGPAVLVGSLATAGLGLFGYGVIIAVTIAYLAVYPFLCLLYSLLELMVAKALGGAGDMQANFNASALPGLATFIIFLPCTVISIPLNWLRLVPVVGLCASCLSLPLSLFSSGLGLYSLYLKYLGFKEVHKLSSARAAGVVILPIFILIALIVVLVVLMYAAIIAFMMSVMAAGSPAPLLVPAG